MDWRIRKLTMEDADAYWDLRLRALRDSPGAFAASFEEEAAIPRETIPARFRDVYVPADENFILGAFADGELVGMVGLNREKRRKLRHRAFVWGMFVIPEMQGRGIGRALLTEVIGRAKTLPGLEQINLSVVSGNMKARGLYVSMGFTAYGLERHALKIDDEYQDDEHMVLFL